MLHQHLGNLVDGIVNGLGALHLDLEGGVKGLREQGTISRGHTHQATFFTSV